MSQILDEFKEMNRTEWIANETTMALAMAYMEIPSIADEAHAAATCATVLQDFGETFVLGVDGFYATGPGGLIAPIYQRVSSASTDRQRAIHELNLHAIQTNAASPGTYPARNAWGMEVQYYSYSARFGNGPHHAGFAIRWYGPNSCTMALMPTAIVPAQSIISAEDAAAFYQAVCSGHFKNASFCTWAMQRWYAAQNATAAAQNPECNSQALRDCLRNQLRDHAARAAEINQRHQDNIDDIISEWGDGSVDSLGGYLAAGAVTGGIGGSLAGPKGAAAGAIVGGIGGGVGWLVQTAYTARTARRKLAEAREAWRTERCSNIQTTARNMRNCADQHCPQVRQALDNWLSQAIASSGC